MYYAIRILERKLDVASFVNQQSRLQYINRKNCLLVQVEFVPYSEITMKTNAEKELYTTHTGEYGIKQKDKKKDTGG